MILVTQDTLPALIGDGDPFLIDAAYNSLDTCLTREVYDALAPRLDHDTKRIYRFELVCQMAALTMTFRGVLIDRPRRAAAIAAFEEEEENAQREAAELSADVWDAREKRVGPCRPSAAYHPTKSEIKSGYGVPGHIYRTHRWPRGVDDVLANCSRCGLSRLRPSPLNAGSSQQVAKLLYELLDVRVRRDRLTSAPTTNDEALAAVAAEHNRLATERSTLKSQENHKRIGLICAAILRARKARKQLGYARSSTGNDGRMRSSMNVGAAETGRWSASKAPDWSGWNIQQIADRLKGIMVADPGLEFWVADLKAAESFIVAYDAEDEGYIDAHETGDPHTAVCKMIYPDMPWTGDTAADKKLAETSYFPWDPHHSYRDHMKRVQHGGNMGRSPQGIARQLHIPVAEAEKFFQLMYGEDGAFPRIKARHRALHAEVQRTGRTKSVLGRVRQFFGRTWDDETLREALGQLEQSPVADVLNLALCRVWADLDNRPNIFDAPNPAQPNRVWLLAQVHDAIWGLRRFGDDDALRRVRDLMTIPLAINGRFCTIPVDIRVGHTLSKKDLRPWNS